MSNDETMETYFDYLDRLRASGVVNMFGAGAYLEREFGMDRKTARAVLGDWMRTFSQRHPKR